MPLVTAYASDSMFYPLTMCALQIVFMIMIIKYRNRLLKKVRVI